MLDPIKHHEQEMPLYSLEMAQQKIKKRLYCESQLINDFFGPLLSKSQSLHQLPLSQDNQEQIILNEDLNDLQNPAQTVIDFIPPARNERKNLGNAMDTERFCQRFAPMKMNPIIHKWVKKKSLCFRSRSKFNHLYRNRSYFFMILGELEQIDGGLQLMAFYKEFKDLVNEQIRFLEKKYTFQEMKVFKKEFDYLEEALTKFMDGYQIQEVFEVVYGRGKNIKSKRKQKMKEAIKLFQQEYPQENLL